MKRFVTGLWVSFAVSFSFATMQSSVSQYGITWTFDKAYEVGHFANGDWWVKGPVSIQSVSPAWNGNMNGSMVNPQPSYDHGYHSLSRRFKPGLRAGFPLTLEPDQSLVSTVGRSAYDGTIGTPCLKTAAILTCLSSIPPPGAFRPGYCGTYKPLHTTANICWNMLPKLSPPVNKPSETDILRNFERPWLDHIIDWMNKELHATDNMETYGREIATEVSEGALYLMLDVPKLDTLTIRMIQLGIDNYSVIKAGGGWPSDGGHQSGRKFPIIFAAVMLDDPDMKAVGTDYGHTFPGFFGEDCQTFYDNNNFPLYGIRHCHTPSQDVIPDTEAPYRNCCTSHTWVGFTLAARMLGAQGIWNHNALFDYVDRWVKEGNQQFPNNTYFHYGSEFIKTVWHTYRNNLPPAATCDVGMTKTGIPFPATVITARVMPNPMRERAFIWIPGLAASRVNEAQVYTSQGDLVKEINSSGTFIWDGTDQQGMVVSPGVYFSSIRYQGKNYISRIVKY